MIFQQVGQADLGNNDDVTGVFASALDKKIPDHREAQGGIFDLSTRRTFNINPPLRIGEARSLFPPDPKTANVRPGALTYDPRHHCRMRPFSF